VTFTYDPKTAAGQVRLLCTDRDPDTRSSLTRRSLFPRPQRAGRPARGRRRSRPDRRVAGAHPEVHRGQRLENNGQAVANALHQQAESLRSRAAAEAAEDDEYIDIIPGPGSIIAPDSWGMI